MYDPSDTFYKFRHLDENKDTIYKDVFIVDFFKLYNHDPEFANWILENHTWFEEHKSQFGYEDIKIVNLVVTTSINDIRSQVTKSLIQIEGVVVQRGKPMLRATTVTFECQKCGEHVVIIQKGQYRRDPLEECPGCEARKWSRVYSESEFIDYQEIIVQELMENTINGSSPDKVKVILTKNLIRSCEPGEQVVIVGYLDAYDDAYSSKTLELKYYVHAHSIVNTTDRDLITLTTKDRSTIQQLMEQPDHLENVRKSIAPTIYGLEHVKEGLAYQLCEGQVKIINETRQRGQIHILLAGSPGGGKSVLGDFIVQCHPKGRKAIGRGASGVGLTASVVKEGDHFVLKAGAMALADNGLLFVDEIEKMSQTDSGAMHPGMEQQCYDEKTEILTENGWVYFKNLGTKKPIKVATLNQETNELEYHYPDEYYKYLYRGEMMFIEDTNKYDLLVTPNHKLYANINKRADEYHGFKLTEIKDLKHRKFKMKKDSIWVGEERLWFYLPSIEKKLNQFKTIKTDEVRVNMDDWLEFLGYYIADGSCNKHRATITQVKKESAKTMFRNLKKLPFKFIQYGNNYTASDVRLATYLIKLGKAPEKYIPKEFLGLSSRQLKILYDALMLGDGHRAKTGGDIYVSTSKKLLNQIQEVLLKIGKSGTIRKMSSKGRRGMFGISKHDCYLISKLNKNTPIVNRSKPKSGRRYAHVSSRQYVGYVYCINVKNHVIYVRRNGRPVWCGNSINIDKADISAVLKTRCSILAACNPIEGVWNDYKMPMDNLHEKGKGLSRPLLDRFALIFVIKQNTDSGVESEVIRHIMKVGANPSGISPPYSVSVLKNIFAYARTLQVKVTKEVTDRLTEFYMVLYEASKIDNTLIITRRQPGDLIRIAEASAKLHGRTETNLQDAENAIRIIAKSLEDYGIDPDTGRVDQARALYGKPQSRSAKIAQIPTIIERRSGYNIDKTRLSRVEFIEYASKLWKETAVEVGKLLDIAIKDGLVYCPTPGYLAVST